MNKFIKNVSPFSEQVVNKYDFDQLKEAVRIAHIYFFEDYDLELFLAARDALNVH